MKGQLGDAGGVTKGRNGKMTTPLNSAIMAVDISRSPPILTSAFQQACETAASSTSRTTTSGEVMDEKRSITPRRPVAPSAGKSDYGRPWEKRTTCDAGARGREHGSSYDGGRRRNRRRNPGQRASP